MSRRRDFNRSERIALYLAADGKCQLCGTELGEDWEPDHIVPYSAGGETAIENGQALCKSCNRDKRTKLMQDNFTLRPVQSRLLKAVQDKDAQIKKIRASGREPTPQEKTVVVWMDPGSGKTLGWLHSINWLYRTGCIDACAVYTPRVNLCQQAELDWNNEYQALHVGKVMGTVNHRDNNPPFLKNQNEFGFASTYQSLVASEDTHVRFFHQKRAALVLDEAQMLGYDSEFSVGTKSAEAVQKLADHAEIVLLLTGTPYRSDGKPLILASYSQADANSTKYLNFDVRASYQEGVREGYLRPFDAYLVNGEALYEYLDGDIETLTVSNMKSGFYKVIEDPGYWHDIVDMTIENVRNFQQVDSRFCGLIACIRQSHARQIEQYIKKQHPNVRALIAVSDESVALDNLRKFKMGKYDILITVAMAHVGYDHKPITVVCCLSSVRDEGWLRQLFARGMRTLFDINADQYVKIIAPDDPKMVAIVETIRAESEQGLKEKEERAGGPGEGAQQRLGATQYAETTTIRAKGMDAANDIEDGEYRTYKELTKKHGLFGASMTGLKGFMRDMTQQKPPTEQVFQPPPPPRKSMMTTKEKENSLKGAIKTVCNSANRAMFDARQISESDLKLFSQAEVKARYGKSTTQMGFDELVVVLNWLNGEYAPSVEKKTGRKVRRIKADV